MKRVFVFLLGICIAACGGKSSSPTRPSAFTPTPSPTSSSQTLQAVTLSVNTGTMKARGDTAQTIATGTFADGTSQNVMATCKDWQSDNITVLTINSSGLVTAQGSGISTITTTCQVMSDHPPVVTFPVAGTLSVTLSLQSR